MTKNLEQKIFIIAINSFSLCLNVIITILIIRKWKQRKIYHCIALSLNMSDILYSVSQVLMFSQQHFAAGTLALFSSLFTFHVSLINIMVLAMERCFAVYFPIFTKINITRKRTNYIILTAWFALGIVYSLFLIIQLLMNIDITEYVGRYFACYMLAESVILVCIHSSIVYKLYATTKNNNLTQQHIQDERERNMRKAIRYCIAITVFFIACTAPFGVALILNEDVTKYHYLISFNAPFNAICFILREIL